ncbi:hypothetical protein BPNPMPFG_008386 (plasmid) [Mesorhizobium sp. AR07]|uniref:hypothetical protein n=1 Tax=Mesorhizobium sp. AR07 TaxID=2865838 RepID=UPI00215ED13D|nr:hypothetical protein [Mesorhizobium sp. AR07]UVK49419.1 hypothetical protein BPNPMPFG_008386 [Mesorhizobium sp. AR07]
MNIKKLSVGAIALSMITGAALAGTTTGTSALDDPAKMSPFFTDAGMKTMKSDTEIKTTWMAMKKEDRAEMVKECGDAAMSKAHGDFCKTTKQLGE